MLCWWQSKQNYTKVVVEIDCQGVAELWKNICSSGLSGAHLIREMQMYELFQEFELVFARRGSNKAAHAFVCERSSCVRVFGFRL
jgi:hypothetical protein